MRPDNPTVGLPIVSPANMLPVQVVHRDAIASDVVSVQIVLPGANQAPAPYLPGQFVTLALPTPRETLYRSYSLCGPGDTGEPWELTIKRMEMGAVSTYFYNHVVEGTLLYSSLPRGTFTLPADMGPETVLMMIAVGSGITPIMGMLRAISRMPRSMRPLAQLHYASRTEDDVIFGDELDEMDPDSLWLQQWHYLSSRGNRMTPDAIFTRAGMFAGRAHWYVCGPDSLKHELQARVREVGATPSQFHAEVFAVAPGPGRPAYRVDTTGATAGPGLMQIAETGASLEIKADETILTALERHGYRAPFSCRAGACGECKLKLLAGTVSPVGEALSTAERNDGYFLACLARPIGEITLASGGVPPRGVARVAAFAGAGMAAARGGAKLGVRVASVVGAGALLVGTWQLTNHYPLSWVQQAAAQGAPPTSTAAGGTGAGTPTSHATSGTGSTSGQPTQPSSQGNPTAAPTQSGQSTPTKISPTATPRPAPTPTVCATTTKITTC